jgi:MYXO-CTERM domain-containing protein
VKLLSQVKLEDVFRSTRQSMSEGAGDGHVVPLVVAGIGLVVLLLVLTYRRRREVGPVALNSPRRLIKEVARAAGLKAGEVKQLRHIAEQQSCSSPLTLLLCPSLLAKGMESRGPRSQKRADAKS